MNFETLRRLGELEHKLLELAKRVEKLECRPMDDGLREVQQKVLEELSKVADYRPIKQQERRTLTLPKKNA